MTSISAILNQLEGCLKSFFKHSGTKVNKTFIIDIMEVLLLYLIMPQRINFTQMERFGDHGEQTYRNLFSRKFDWLRFNCYLAIHYFNECRGKKAIAIDPSYISKSGKHTHGVGYFWSGTAGRAKYGLEILGISLIETEAHQSMHLLAAQTPGSSELKENGESLTETYLKVIGENQLMLKGMSNVIVADAWFSKKPFVDGLLNMGFDLVSRLRNDAVLRYLFKGEQTGKRGRPKRFDGKIKVSDIDMSQAELRELPQYEETFYCLEAYSVALKRNVKLVIAVDAKNNRRLYFSTDTNMSGEEIIEIYRCRFQCEFNYRDAKQFTGLCHSQARSKEKLHFAFNASLTAVNLAKIICKKNGWRYSIAKVKLLMFSAYQIKRFICKSAFRPNKHLNAKIVKELFELVDMAA